MQIINIGYSANVTELLGCGKTPPQTHKSGGRSVMDVVVMFCMSGKGDNRKEKWGFSHTVGVNEVRFPRLALSHGNM